MKLKDQGLKYKQEEIHNQSQIHYNFYFGIIVHFISLFLMLERGDTN